MQRDAQKSKRAGAPPGTLVHIGKRRAERVRIRVIDYAEGHLEERDVPAIEESFPFRDRPTITWINIDGIHDIDVIEKAGKHFDLHPLILEDILNTGQRPKLEDYTSHLFIVLKMLSYDPQTHQTSSEQVSLILGKNFVISFQETEGDVFDPVRERIRSGKGRIRKMGADYLAYALVDAIVDHYFIILETIGERIEALEEELITDPDPQTMTKIHRLKREMLLLRKSIWPLREVVSALQRGESQLIREATGIFLRDIYDHTIQVIDTIESYRDMLSGMLDLYLSTISNKMNTVMKVLTIIATIFIPLTFIAGIYGMNFEFMPELHWRWGYPVALAIMLLIGIVMLMFFKKRNWL